MKKALLIFAIVGTIAIAGTASAQAPMNIQIYFDNTFQEAAANCPDDPPGSVIDTIYVVGHNFDMWLQAAEFMVAYPTQMWWLGDQYDTDLHIGNTKDGISLAWNLPKNGFGATLLCTATFAWQCQGCGGVTGDGYPLDVVPNPNQGYLRIVRWPDAVAFDVIGMRSYVCPQVPVEETTWGQIKALYN
jgi:hypothetical protein